MRLYRLAKGMTNYPLKGHGLFHVTHFCMYNCGLRKISPRHAIDWDQWCSRWRSCVCCTLDGWH